MNARASAETERLFTFTITAPKVVRGYESLNSLGWCALVPPSLWVPHIRVYEMDGDYGTKSKFCHTLTVTPCVFTDPWA